MYTYAENKMKFQRVRVPVVIVAFMIATTYASFCATQCALDSWPGSLQQAETQSNCSGDSQGSHHDDSDDSACPASHHLDAFVPADAGITQPAIETAGHLNVPLAPVHALGAFSLIQSTLRASDLAPPYCVSSSLYQQTSVLRI